MRRFGPVASTSLFLVEQGDAELVGLLLRLVSTTTDSLASSAPRALTRGVQKLDRKG